MGEANAVCAKWYGMVCVRWDGVCGHGMVREENLWGGGGVCRCDTVNTPGGQRWRNSGVVVCGQNVGLRVIQNRVGNQLQGTQTARCVHNGVLSTTVGCRAGGQRAANYRPRTVTNGATKLLGWWWSVVSI